MAARARLGGVARGVGGGAADVRAGSKRAVVATCLVIRADAPGLERAVVVAARVRVQEWEPWVALFAVVDHTVAAFRNLPLVGASVGFHA